MMLNRDLIKILLEFDMDTPVFFDIDIPNPEEFDLIAINGAIELAEENGEEPLIILSAEVFEKEPEINLN